MRSLSFVDFACEGSCTREGEMNLITRVMIFHLIDLSRRVISMRKALRTGLHVLPLSEILEYARLDFLELLCQFRPNSLLHRLVLQ